MIPPFKGPDGTVYTFDHMKPFDDAVSVTVNGKRYHVPVVVIFSSHCFTDTRNGTVKTTDDDFLLSDVTGNRAFCPTRYKVSIDLPDQIQGILGQAHAAQCYRLDAASGYIFLHDSDHPNKWRGWYVFFSFDRSKAGAPLALRVSVTSHHYRQTHPQNLRWKGSMKFPALAADWMSKRPDFLELFSPIEDEAPATVPAPGQSQDVAGAEKEKPA